MANTEQALKQAAIDALMYRCTGISEGQFPDEYVGLKKFADELLAAASAEAATPVAWAHLAENGNIRIWSSAPETVRRLAMDEGLVLTPLYTAAPQASQPIGQPSGDWMKVPSEAVELIRDAAKLYEGEWDGQSACRTAKRLLPLIDAANSQPVSGAVMTDEQIEKLADAHLNFDTGDVVAPRYYGGFDKVRNFARSILSASGQAVSEKATMWADALNARADWEENATKLATPGTIKLMRDVSEFLSSTPAQQTEAPVNVQAGMDDKANACIVLEGGAYCLGPCATCDEERLIQKIGSIAINLSRKIMHIVNGTWMPAGAIQIQKKIESLLFSEIRSALAAAPAPVQTEAQQSETEVTRMSALVAQLDKLFKSAGYSDAQRLEIASVFFSNRADAIAKEKAKC